MKDGDGPGHGLHVKDGDGPGQEGGVVEKLEFMGHETSHANNFFE